MSEGDKFPLLSQLNPNPRLGVFAKDSLRLAHHVVIRALVSSLERGGLQR
ncbi:hypothetical protein DEO72_LG9g1724 [Vigna unguiculata]|uniref:Uncharacterized protein n=1 Tax=Vigna unguiculata TaxID=3917 RepID=A0A4D6MYU4_VIGUN|nr:hypothetical protein DEO72_LG9g1724 [Vigna unguiculata]